MMPFSCLTLLPRPEMRLGQDHIAWDVDVNAFNRVDDEGGHRAAQNGLRFQQSLGPRYIYSAVFLIKRLAVLRSPGRVGEKTTKALFGLDPIIAAIFVGRNHGVKAILERLIRIKQ